MEWTTFIMMIVGSCGFVALLWDWVWKRRLHERYANWKYALTCSPEDFRRIREKQIQNELQQFVARRQKQLEREIETLKARLENQLEMTIWKRAQGRLWEKSARSNE